MGDPSGAASRVLKTLKPDGTWMIVEPFANDKVEDNLTQAGERRLSQLVITSSVLPKLLSI